MTDTPQNAAAQTAAGTQGAADLATGRSFQTPGDRVPKFTARSASNPAFRFDSVAGRWLVLGFLGSLRAEPIRSRAAAVMAEAGIFNDDFAALFLVSQDPEDETSGRLADRLPGRRVIWDDGGELARLFGALPAQSAPGQPAPFTPFWLVIDPSLTVTRLIPFRHDGGDVAELLDFMRNANPPATWLGFEVPVPILVLPHVFEPEFCDRLVALYEENGGETSGFMRDQGGKTIAVHDPSFKVRRDYMLEDAALVQQVQARILRRIVPQIERVHYFKSTRMERYLVACYDSEEGGHFRPHRDNTTHGTAHRRFAVSINLNDGFDGGEVSFPEYSPRGFKAPKGGAVIFSCSMLHAVSKVTAGRRFAFLPFLYDDAAARIREQNASKVPTAAGYRA